MKTENTSRSQFPKAKTKIELEIFSFTTKTQRKTNKFY